MAHFLGAQCLGVNRTHFIHEYPFEISILKNVFDKKTGKIVPYGDFLEHSIDYQFFEDNDNSRFILHENTSKEILELVKEGLDLNHNKSELQIRFNKFLIEESKNIFFNHQYPRNFTAIDTKDLHTYRLRAYLQSPICLAKGYYGQSYLVENLRH